MNKVDQCPICSSADLKTIKEYTYNYPGDEVEENLKDPKYVRLWILFNKVLKTQSGSTKFKVNHCNQCSFIFTNPRFSEEEMALKYQTITELGSVKKRVGGLYNVKNYAEDRGKRFYSLIKDSYPDLKGKKILDFGGQRGDNLLPFVNEMDCHILDYENWDLPDGITYKGQTLSDLSEKYDVILFNHTLEHVVDPLKYVNTLKEYLNPGGILYIEVPLGAFFWEWRRIKEPYTHVNFFSEKSLIKLLNLSGLETIHLSSKYQKLQPGLEWCINIVGKNSTSGSTGIAKGKSATSHRLFSPYYYTIMAADRVLKRLGLGK